MADVYPMKARLVRIPIFNIRRALRVADFVQFQGLPFDRIFKGHGPVSSFGRYPISLVWKA